MGYFEKQRALDHQQQKRHCDRVSFSDGAYYNFPETQIIAPGIRMIRAKGHTNGNSIVIVENDGLFYMIHGDITYVDEALHEDKLSVVYDDRSEEHTSELQSR